MNPNLDLHQKLMVVRLNCSYSFGRVTDKQITNETNTTKNTKALVVRKELLPGPSGVKLRALVSVLSAFYKYHTKVTLSSINDGERLLPVVFYMDYMTEYGTYKTLVNEAFDDFKQHYAANVQQAAPLLNGAYNANDYPDESELLRFLNFRLKTLPLPVADTLLTTVGSSIQADVDSFLDEAVSAALNDVNERMKKALQRMVGQLSDPRGKVYDSMTESLAELIAFLPSWNVTADDSLTLLCDEVKDKILRVGPDELRHDEGKRKATADAAAEILRRMM